MTDESKDTTDKKNSIVENNETDSSWARAEEHISKVTCDSAYDTIVSAMVDYDPKDRYNLFARSKGSGKLLNLNPDMSLRLHRGPPLPQHIQKHVSKCDFCQALIKQLSNLNLAKGELAIASNLSHKKSSYCSNPKLAKILKESGWKPRRDRFKGTPSEIIEGMVRDASQYIKPSDHAEFITRKAKFIKHVLGLIGHSQPKAEDGSVSITDIEFLQAMAKGKAISIVADPWFILAPRPPNIRALAGKE